MELIPYYLSLGFVPNIVMSFQILSPFSKPVKQTHHKFKRNKGSFGLIKFFKVTFMVG